MKRYYNRLKLCSKIILLFTIMIAVTVGIFAVILYKHFKRTVSDSVINAIDSAVTANTNELQALLERMEMAIDLVHANEIVYSGNETDISPVCEMIISYYPEDTNENIVMLRKDYTANLKYFNDSCFKACFGENTPYSAILFTDISWPIHVFMPKLEDFAGRTGFSSSLRVQEEEWYQKASKLDGTGYWFTESGTEGELCMAKLLKYHYVDRMGILQKRNLGVLALSFPVSEFFDYLDVNGLIPGTDFFLMDENGEMVYSDGDEALFDGMLAEMRNAEVKEAEEIVHEGEEYRIYQRMLPLGLRMAAIVPVQGIRKMTTDTIGIIGILGIVIVGIAVFITIWIGMIVVKPLKEFAMYMESGSTEPFPYDKTRTDELGTLYKAFNNLMIQLKASMKKERQAQFSALQAQINPHFIYNTLNSVSCMALIEGEKQIAEVLGNLANIMRYNISNFEELVTVAEEIENVRQYENIQRFRYRDSVRFEYVVAPEVRNLLVPKLIIQPLVENALLHGTNFREDDARVRVEVCMGAEGVRILVWDNGKEADTVMINNYIEEKIQMSQKEKSLGVRNVNERIAVIFGKGAGLFFRKDENGYTIAEILIPADCTLRWKQYNYEKNSSASEESQEETCGTGE